MKIVCDNCATKYSIADDKVRGKVFKIRCKKCSHIIVVRGTDGAAAAAEPAPKFDQKETKVFDYSGADGEAAAAAGQAAQAPQAGDPPVWHLVIDREQVGPMNADEVRQRFARGEVDSETYAWREGFGDWQKLSAIGDFGDLMAAAPSAQSGYGDGAESTARNAADLFAQGGGGSARHDGEDDGLFASSPPTAADPAPGAFMATSHSGETPAVSDMFAGHGGGSGGGGLFESPAASRGGGGGGGLFESAPASGGGLFEAGASAPSPRVDAARMTGQRNENSVLFSLSNLQALAVGPQGGGAAPASTPQRPGYASSQAEGSGLIDIRAMAASTLGAPTLGGSSAASASSDEELAPFGASFSPVAAPVLMPMAGTSSMPRWLWGVIGGGVLLVGVLIFLVIKLLVARPQPVIMNAPPTVGTGGGTSTTTPGAIAKTEEKKTPGEEKKDTSAEEKKDTAKTKISDRSTRQRAKSDSKQVQKDLELMKTPTEKGAPAPATKKAGGGEKKAGGDDLDRLLQGAVGGKDITSPKSEGGGGGGRERSAPSAVDESLPLQLKPSDIQRGMAGIKSKVQNCYAQYNVPGMVNVTVTINPSGRVSGAQVTGKFAGTPTGTCVASAVKTASFPRFRGEAMSGIDYPFMLSK